MKTLRRIGKKFSAWITNAELPLRLALMMALSIFVAEVLEAVVVHYILRLELGVAGEVLIESFLIVVLLSPMLYYFLYRPLKESERQLRYLSNQILMAQETERKRISRELHDELGQAMSLMKLRLRSIESGMPEDQMRAREECRDVLGYIDGVIEDVRRLSRDLSPAVLEDLGLTSALRWMINGFKTNYGIEVISDIMNIDHLVSNDSAILIYRIFQEAFTNIGKHAEANTASVAVSENGRWLSLSVADDGKGFDVAKTLSKKDEECGLGLVIMEERVRMLGGSLKVKSERGKGTHIAVTIPMEKGQKQ